jgi:hypothetical protein
MAFAEIEAQGVLQIEARLGLIGGEIAASNGRRSASSLRSSLSESLRDRPNPLEVSHQITSPQSTLSSAGFGLDVAPLCWFELLAGDV